MPGSSRASNARLWVGVLAVGAVLGLVFTGYSTYDFALYLDRQVHGIHCSFIPGLVGTDVSGSTGCHVTLMSPYSSVLRRMIWGGFPVSLPGMAVFALLLYRALALLVEPAKAADRSVTGAVLGLATLPVLASIVMGGLAFVVLDAACKLCIGTYGASLVVFAGALGLRRARASYGALLDDDPMADQTQLASPAAANPGREVALAFAQLGVFVLLPTAAWAAFMPDHDPHIGTCGSLVAPEDTHGFMLPMDPPRAGAVDAIELLDPLCPSCQGLEERLALSGHQDRLVRKAVLFPLDNSCNWMVGATLHPGACTISEAVLCAEGRAPEVVAWAFDNQEAIRAATTDDPDAAATMVTAAFPDLKSCVGKPAVRTRLNHGLRWAVKNELAVLTPQLFIGDQRVCDADTDLGLEYALDVMLARGSGAEESP